MINCEFTVSSNDDSTGRRSGSEPALRVSRLRRSRGGYLTVHKSYMGVFNRV